MSYHNIEDLFSSVNDIYGQLDEGEIEHDEACELLTKVCQGFLTPSTYWSSSSGEIELLITLAQAERGDHRGACDEDIASLALEPNLEAQLKALKPEVVKQVLKGYGAWDDDELSHHSQNLQRLLWIACGDINDQIVMGGI